MKYTVPLSCLEILCLKAADLEIRMMGVNFCNAILKILVTLTQPSEVRERMIRNSTLT